MASSGENRASLDLERLSNTQESRIVHIVDQVLKDTGNKASQRAGESRHDAKEQNRAVGAKGSHEINLNTPKSYATERKYKACMSNFMRWNYQEFKIKDPMQMGGNIKEFCATLVEKGFSRNSFEGYTKSLAAFYSKGGFLDQYMTAKGGHFKPADNVLQEARGMKDACANKEHVRAYADAPRIVENLSGNAKTAAALQLQCGLRISDATHIKAANWDATKGEGVCNSKGGQAIHFKPSPEIAAKITAEIKAHGVFRISHSQYNQELRAAVANAGQVWEGSHGLRATFSRANMQRCKAIGMSYRDALKDTGEKLGHHRPADEVTKTYTAGIAPW